MPVGLMHLLLSAAFCYHSEIGMLKVSSGNPTKIDILWLVEHIAREFDVACIFKAIARQRHGLRVEIRNLYQHIGEYLPEFDPAIVVHPYVYFVDGALATEDVFRRWPDAVHVNAAWEQIHYRAHYKIKAPADTLAREQVVHLAWGDFYKKFLTDAGVPPDHVIVNGHPAYQLYRQPYRSFFDDRLTLAAKHELDADKQWIFVPENYRWAFAQKKLDFFVSLGGDREELNGLINFSIPSLIELLKGCREASLRSDVEVIFRPRPAVSTARIVDFFRREIGGDLGKIHFIKEGSVREWVLASDQVVSSYSTSLLEAAVAGKPAWMFEPIPIPEGLHCEWYDSAPRIRTAAEFGHVCAARKDATEHSLARWVQSNLLPEQDPLEKIVGELWKMRSGAPAERNFGPLPPDLHSKAYFNKDSHEMDEFTPEDSEARSSRWSLLLFGESMLNEARNDGAPSDVINKSMNRDDLLRPDAASLVAELNGLIRNIYSQGTSPSSWVGTLPKYPIKEAETSVIEKVLRMLGRPRSAKYVTDSGEEKALHRGDIQRLDYRPLDNAEDDLRYPWFLYWEIHWVLRYMRPRLQPGMRLLDAGGAASLFTCYMASCGYELHSVDLNEKLLAHGDGVARKMGWNSMHSYCMDMRKLDFPDAHFDHAFSICVFEHLDFDVKQSALAEIARCLKPGGILSLTFDYRNPAPGVVGIGKDPSPRNALKTEADIHRSFLASGHFRLLGNPEFQDNAKSYLQHPTFGNTPYTFGAVFLQKV